MHLPVGTQYFCICSNESNFIDFYTAADTIFANFGIKIIIQPISFEACVDLLKVENDRNFIILLMTENPSLRLKALSTFHGLFEKSPCNHKLDLIDNIRQIYFTLLGSLNLALVFTGDGALKTFGIQVEQGHSEIKSNLISKNIEPVPIEIVNIQPIILDMTRCGVLEPVLYFVARDFGTCIAQVLLPGSNSWSVAYLIQCDDSGRNDLDMVKVCLVKEVDEDKNGEQLHQKDSASVLNNPNYPLCRAISILLYDLKHLPPTLDVVTPLITTISDALAFATADNPEIFPDAEGLLQVKKKYSTLFTEITKQLVTIEDHRQEKLAGIIKNLRRMINFLNIDVKVLAQKTVTTTKCKWYDDARSYSNPDSRYWGDTLKLKKKRLESEQRDGIITMPLLEPYLDIKWPRSIPSCQDKYPFPALQEYAKAMTIKEQDLLNNKRFGV